MWSRLVRTAFAVDPHFQQQRFDVLPPTAPAERTG
jgi:hypothetical protein